MKGLYLGLGNSKDICLLLKLNCPHVLPFVLSLGRNSGLFGKKKGKEAEASRISGAEVEVRARWRRFWSGHGDVRCPALGRTHNSLAPLHSAKALAKSMSLWGPNVDSMSQTQRPVET